MLVVGRKVIICEKVAQKISCTSTFKLEEKFLGLLVLVICAHTGTRKSKTKITVAFTCLEDYTYFSVNPFSKMEGMVGKSNRRKINQIPTFPQIGGHL